MKTILVGTTNPSKALYFKDLLSGCDAEFVTLADLHITDEPEETGATPGGCARLDDEAMIAHYARLARSLGGRALTYYLDGAAAYVRGEVYGFQATREEAKSWAFYLTDRPEKWRREGWPLDTLSVDLQGRYFLDPQRPRFPQEKSSYRPRLRTFLMDKFGL